MMPLKKLFAPPLFDDEIKTHQAYLLNIIVWTLICVPIPFVIYAGILKPENLNRTFIQAAFGETVNIILLFMLHRKLIKEASILQVSMFWLFFTVTAFTGNGVQSEAYLLGYGLVIVIAGILLGGSGALAFTLLSLAAGGWMTYEQLQSAKSFGFDNSPLTTWIISLVLFPVGAVLQYLGSYNVRNALARASASEEKYRLISQISSDYTFATKVYKDGSSSLSWVAGAFEKITGYTFEEYVASGGWLAHVHPDDLEKDAQDMEKLYKNQDVKSEIRTFIKSGETHWEQIFAHPIWDKKENRLVGIYGAIRDITEQKQIEAALAHERDLLQLLMDNIPDLVYFKDVESRFVRINQAHAHFLGVDTPQDVIGKTDFNFQTPELALKFNAEEKTILETGQPIWNRIEFNPTKDGKTRWLSANKTLVKDSSGNIIGTIGVTRDITEQKKIEAALAYERDILQIFMDNIPDLVYFKDTESRFVRINQAHAHFLGVDKPQGALGKTDLDFQAPELAREFIKEEKRITETGEPVWNRIEYNPTKDGKPRWLSSTKVAAKNELGQTIGIIGISRNITEQKKAEELEQSRRAMLESVIKLGKAVADVNDFDTTYEKIWHSVHDVLEFDRLAIFLYNAERDSLDRALGTNMQGEIEKLPGMWYPLEERSTLSQVFKKPDGLYFTRNFDVENNIAESDEMYGVKDYAAVAVWVGEKPVAVICVDRILTQLPISDTQLEALRLFAGYAGLALENARLNTILQNELSQHKETLLQQSAILNGIPDMAWLKDKDSRYIAINKQFAKTAGLKISEIIGKTDFDIWQTSYAEKYRSDDLEVMQTRQMKNAEELQLDSTGTISWVETTKTPILNSNGEVIGTTGIARVITERKKAQEAEQNRRVMLENIIKLGKTVAEVNDLTTALEKIWHGIHDGLQFDRLAIFLFDSEQNSLYRALGTDLQGNIVKKSELPNDKLGILSHVFNIPDGLYFTHNFDVDHNIAENDEMYGVKDYAAVAVWVGEKPVAVICADRLFTKLPITDIQVEGLRLFAGYAGLSIENARLNTTLQNELTLQTQSEERERHRREILEKVIKLGQQTTEVYDLRTTLIRIWDGVHNGLGFDRLGIRLYNPERKSMDGTFGTDNQGEMIDEQNSWILLDQDNPESRSLLYVLEKPDNISFTHSFEDDYDLPVGRNMSGVKDHAAIAAWAGDKPVAIISVDHRITGRPITEEELEGLRLFAGYAGLAIENARLNEKIKNELSVQMQSKEQEKHRREILEKVVKLGQQVTEVYGLRALLIKIWNGLHNDLGFDRVGIFLYNPLRKSMDGTFGTNNEGERVDEWHTWFLLEEDNRDSKPFIQALDKPDTIYFTHFYEGDYRVPQGHIMSGVKDHALIGAWAGDKPVAIISVDHLITGRPISEEQLEALRLFAGYIGLAIENTRLNTTLQDELSLQVQSEERERHRGEILEKVVKLGQQVTEVYDLRTTLIRIWHGLHDDLGFDRPSIWLYNPQRKSMDGTFGTNNQGEMTDEWDASHLMEEDSLDIKSFIKAIEKPDTIYFTHSYEDEYQVPEGHTMAGVKDHALVGAWSGDKPVAIISVDQRITDRPISEEQLEALRLFAGYAGLSIENARLKDAIEQELMEQIKAEETEQRRRVMMEKVIKLGKQVTGVSDFQTTLKNIWSAVRHDLDFDRVGLFLYNPQENSMDGAYGTDRQGDILETWHVKISLSIDDHIQDAIIFHKVLDQPDGFYFTKDFEKEVNLPPGHEMAGVKDYAVVAALVGNKPVAIIAVDQLTTGRTFTDEQLEAMRLFAGYAGLAISNANLNTALEEELAQRKSFIDELEMKNAELERFTYTVSHDLKSPLVTIRGFLGYLEKDAYESNFDKFNHDKKRIETAVEKMQDLLRDLLELSRIGRLMNTPVEIPFDEIVKDALEIVHGQTEAGNVLVDYKKNGIIIKCDRVRMTEVIQNLIDNAIKFMGNQTNPRIEIGALSNQKNEQVFYVKDNGIGIAPEFHGKIFGLFDKLTTESDGTGIGLALVKRIIEVHGGRIWLESQLNLGTTFYFTLA